MEFGESRVKRCRYGWMLYSGAFKWDIPTSFELYGEYSESEIACLRQLLSAGDTVLDVGANIGDLTVPIAQIVGERGNVYAFEANPANFNYLCANLALNSLRNVRPLNCFVTIAESGVNPFFTGERWPAQFMAIDDLDLPACALIKIDVDGGERSVLRSAAATIARHRPVLYFENDVKAMSRELLAHALGLDYDLYWHAASVFNPDNFAGNRKSYWDTNLISGMVLGIPAERGVKIEGLVKIAGPDDWWH
jgi:hypothetical protein